MKDINIFKSILDGNHLNDYELGRAFKLVEIMKVNLKQRVKTDTTKIIKIEVSGGLVQDVKNLPKDWTYEIDDKDIKTEIINTTCKDCGDGFRIEYENTGNCKILKSCKCGLNED